MHNITVGISTVEENLSRSLRLGRLILELGRSDVVREVLIVCQKCSGDSAEMLNDRMVVVRTSQVGLSRSRNAVIERARGEYVWFLDDDVTITRESLDALASVTGDADVVVGQIGCSNEAGFYKDYNRKAVLPFWLLRVSSIELIVRRRKVLQDKVFFDERLGLGAEYPCGEENAFLLDLYRAGAKFERLNKIVVYHPCGGEVRDYFRTESQMFARGIVARKLGWFRGFLLCVYWAQRVFKKPESLRLATSMVRGFFAG